MTTKHEWFKHKQFRPLIVCKSCGIVQNERNDDSDCPGKIRPELKENRTRGGVG